MAQPMNKKLFWLFALSSSVYFNQGIEGLPSQALFYYFKETLGLSADKIMFLGTITTAAWVIKPVIGYLIDKFFSKKAWIYISLILDIALVIILGVLKFPLFILIVIMLLTSTNAAFRDVSVDGIMCVEGKSHGITGKIQSVQWMSISAALLVNGVAGGLIAEHWGYQAGFLCLIPFYLINGLFGAFYKEEKPQAPSINASLIKDIKRLFADKKLIIVGIFIFLYRYSPSFGTPLFFVQRDVFKWDKVWIGILGTLGTAFSIIGALIYYKFSKKINIKKWLYISVFLGALTTLTYLYYTPYTAVIYDVIYSLIGMFIFLITMDFMARSTAPGLEATSFAFLCSFNNLAIWASNFSGALLYPVIGLNWLIIISAATSFLCLFLIKKI
jgi:MFS family permease